MTEAVKRIMHDLKKISKANLDQISASPDGDDIMNWTCLIFGPDDTIWEGGIFQLKMTFDENYPIRPPKVIFTTEMFHPNIFADGSICLDILKDQWSSVYSVSTILLAIQSLLTDPNPNSPANVKAAQLYLHNKKEYNRMVRQYTQKSIDMC